MTHVTTDLSDGMEGCLLFQMSFLSQSVSDKRITITEWFQQKSHHSPLFLSPTHVTTTIQRAGLFKSYTSENFDWYPEFYSIALLMLRLSTHLEPSLALKFFTLPRCFILLELPFIQPTRLILQESLKGQDSFVLSFNCILFLNRHTKRWISEQHLPMPYSCSFASSNCPDFSHSSFLVPSCLLQQQRDVIVHFYSSPLMTFF